MQTRSLITFRNFSMQASYYPLNTFYFVGTEFIFFSLLEVLPCLSFHSLQPPTWLPTVKAGSAAVTCRLEVSLLVGVRMGGGGLYRDPVLLAFATLGIRTRTGRTLQPS